MQVLPVFDVAARFIESSELSERGTRKLSFATQSCIKDGKNINFKSYAESQGYASLKINVDERYYLQIRHLLKPSSELSLKVSPSAYTFNNVSGVSYSLIEIQPLALPA